MTAGFNSVEWVLKHRINLDDIGLLESFEDLNLISEEPLNILAFHPNEDAILCRTRMDEEVEP